eukprot:3132022-Pyramimonas_sp.AAC.1
MEKQALERNDEVEPCFFLRKARFRRRQEQRAPPNFDGHSLTCDNRDRNGARALMSQCSMGHVEE